MPAIAHRPENEENRIITATLSAAVLGGTLAGPPGAIIGGLGGLLLADQVNKDKFMTKKRAFISFDYDHDSSLKHLLVGQAKNDDTPFDISDHSIKEPILTAWKDNARARIKGCDVVIVICGEYTHVATGVSAEIKIAQEEGVPYFLLWGYSEKTCSKPTAAKSTDKIYNWTWDNLKSLINGGR